jgi:hypothetical protein
MEHAHDERSDGQSHIRSQQWFRDAASASFGSQFILLPPFTITGGADQVAGFPPNSKIPKARRKPLPRPSEPRLTAVST